MAKETGEKEESRTKGWERALDIDRKIKRKENVGEKRNLAEIMEGRFDYPRS
jgi:hypothetical protein